MGYTVIGGTKTRTARVLWMLEELGQSYEHLPVPPRDEAVVAFNPTGKIPVLLDDGAPITDSTAIIQYLADKHEALTFPAGTLNRARQDGFTQLILDELDAVLWTAARHSFILPEDMRLPEIKDSLKWEFERSQQTVMQRIGAGPFVMGDQMTVPDILLAHCGGWAIGAKFPVAEPLNAYVKRMRERPAFMRFMALS